MIVLAIHLGELSAKVRADVRENRFKRVYVLSLEDMPPVFWRKHQMHMKQENAVSSSAVFI